MYINKIEWIIFNILIFILSMIDLLASLIGIHIYKLIELNPIYYLSEDFFILLKIITGIILSYILYKYKIFPVTISFILIYMMIIIYNIFVIIFSVV